MKTKCTTKPIEFHPLHRRNILGQFDGGAITSDGGSLLLREIEHRTQIISEFAECFTDHRDPNLIEHSVKELLAQRIYGLALGYEDVNDHDQLRHDPDNGRTSTHCETHSRAMVGCADNRPR